MTPTICSGKTRKARSDMRHNGRRPPLNLAFTDIVTCDYQRSSICSEKQSQQEKSRSALASPITVSVKNEQNYRQLLVDISDNAVTSSSTPLDGSQLEAPSSIGSNLRSRFLSNHSSQYTNSNTSYSPLSSPSISSQYSYGNNDDNDDISDDFISVIAEDDEELSRSTAKNEMHFGSNSMTSCDTDNSANINRGNHPLWRDKLLAKHRLNSNKLSNIRNPEGLLSIAIKTIKLVKRNNQLQQRLTQLQLETSEFIQSVLSNQENRHFRANIQQNVVREVENV